MGKLMVESLIAHGLGEKAQTTKIRVGFISDGADFSRTRGHTSSGFQILDFDTKKPGTGEYMYLHGRDAKGRQRLKNYHCSEVVNFCACLNVKRHRTIFNFSQDESKEDLILHSIELT